MESVRRIFFIFLTLLVSTNELSSHSGPVFYSSVEGNDFNVFEENGKVGLKDQQGHILIPAQYDAVGWSNGKFSILNNVTGVRVGQLWGLINLQNNRITKTEFIDLVPAEGSLLIATKKIQRTVKILTGCINTAGKEIIPFDYDGIRISSFRAIVFKRSGTKFNHGLIDLENKVLIPLTYRNIYPLGSLRYAVENYDDKTAIFSEDGKQLSGFLIDSLSSFKKDFAIIYQNQREGLIDRLGEIKLEPIFREIRINDDGSIDAKQGDAWLWLDGENKSAGQVNADSITPIGKNLLKVKNSGKIQLTDKDFKPISPLLFASLGSYSHGKAVVKNSAGKCGVINQQGKIIVKPVYNYLVIDRNFFRVNFQNRWSLLDSTAKELTAKSYEFIGDFNGSIFPAKQHGYWGALDQTGKEIVACVHDSIVQQLADLIVVKFKGKYGVINTKENWILSPHHDRLNLITSDRYLQTNGATTFLKSLKGDIVYFSDNKLIFKNDHLWEYLSSGNIWKINMDGQIVDREVQPADIQTIFPESEGLRGIKRDGRYGFVDSRGRLRIANRYEGIKEFRESLAAAKILGKWGFINHRDNIAIQPVYDEVFSFQNGYAVVRQKSFFGLIDKSGKVVLPVRYDSITSLGNKRFKVKQNQYWGLADANGKLIINTKYEEVTDLGNGYLIVQRDGKFGLLTLQGVSTIPQIYDFLTYDSFNNQYLAVKRAEWASMKL